MTPMMQMWAMFGLFAVLAALFIVVPFLRRESVVAVDSDANAERIEIYYQRLAELQDELADNKLDKNLHQESVNELKRRLLNELSPEKQLSSRGNNRIFALTGVAFLIAVSAVFYSFTGSQKQIADWYKAIDMLPEYGERAVLQKGEPLNENELQAFALGLRTKLAQSGDDAVAWMLLGRVVMSLGDRDMAAQAFDKALKMQPDNHNVLINYSQVLLLEGSDQSMNRAAKMLSKVLQKDPTNVDAISLLALIAYEKQDWVEAKAAFEVLLSTLTKDDPRYSMIEQRIAEIDAKLTPSSQTAVASLSVTVNVDEAVRDQLPQNGTLFVFAKAAQGPAMPLAVAKLTEFNFPLSVTLDDNMAMLPSLKLSNFTDVIVTARVSIDDAVTPSVGELEGQSKVIELSTQQSVEVNVSRVITSTGS